MFRWVLNAPLHSYKVLVKCSATIVEVMLDLSGRLGTAGGEYFNIIVKLLAQNLNKKLFPLRSNFLNFHWKFCKL